MSEFIIANRYAKALFELADQEKLLDPVYVSLREIGSLLKEKSDFKVFIHNPLLSLEERQAVIEKVFKNRIPKLLYTFILFLNAKERLDILADVVICFDELYLEKNNQIRGSLETAFALQDGQIKNIQQRLGEKYNKKVSLEHSIKGDLLGGFRLLTNGILFDSSIKSQLEQFRQKVLIEKKAATYGTAFKS